MTIGLIANNDGSGAVQLGGTNAIALDTSFNATMAGYVSAPNTFGFKNRLINGNMNIDQRYAGASVTPTGNQYTLDRWQAVLTVASKYAVRQTPSATETGYAVRVGAGFTNYLAVTSASSYAVQTTDTFCINQLIEGNNVSDLAWGTTSAATVTLSFWVNASATGTYGGSLANGAANRSYPFSYTVNAANTWEYKTVVIAGDQTGTWAATTGTGMYVRFGLGSGSTYSGTVNTWQVGNIVQPTGTTSVVATSGATFYVTGVQLEKGSIATSFDFRDYGRELIMCQRYYEPLIAGSGGYGIVSTQYNTGNMWQQWVFKVVKRSLPTLTFGTGATATSGVTYTPGTDNVWMNYSTVFTVSNTSGSIVLQANSEL